MQISRKDLLSCHALSEKSPWGRGPRAIMIDSLQIIQAYQIKYLSPRTVIGYAVLRTLRA